MAQPKEWSTRVALWRLLTIQLPILRSDPVHSTSSIFSNSCILSNRNSNLASKCSSHIIRRHWATSQPRQSCLSIWAANLPNSSNNSTLSTIFNNSNFKNIPTINRISKATPHRIHSTKSSLDKLISRKKKGHLPWLIVSAQPKRIYMIHYLSNNFCIRWCWMRIQCKKNWHKTISNSRPLVISCTIQRTMSRSQCLSSKNLQSRTRKSLFHMYLRIPLNLFQMWHFQKVWNLVVESQTLKGIAGTTTRYWMVGLAPMKWYWAILLLIARAHRLPIWPISNNIVISIGKANKCKAIWRTLWMSLLKVAIITGKASQGHNRGPSHAPNHLCLMALNRTKNKIMLRNKDIKKKILRKLFVRTTLWTTFHPAK